MSKKITTALLTKTQRLSVTNMPNLTEPQAAETPFPQVKKKVPGTDDTVMSNGVESHGGESEATNRSEADGQTENGEGVTAPIEGGEEAEEEGSEVVPVGSVDGQGNVIDKSGNIVGKTEGDVPEGSLVDTEGDVIDAEGNVIGKADVESATKEAEGATGVSGEAVEGVEKPELAGPFGVQDNGEITNATGVPIGKLAEGDPQDLVGQSIKEIDMEGNLKAESGSTIGKVELSPEVLDKDDQAAGELGDTVPTKGGEAGGELGEKAPEGEEAVGELEEANPELDLSILDGMKVNKLGKIVKEDVSANSFQNSISIFSPN
jgi:hypothetical protein